LFLLLIDDFVCRGWLIDGLVEGWSVAAAVCVFDGLYVSLTKYGWGMAVVCSYGCVAGAAEGAVRVVLQICVVCFV
jgi:hypothetical protein